VTWHRPQIRGADRARSAADRSATWPARAAPGLMGAIA